MVEENQSFLTEQITTYIGNKRSLFDFIAPVLENVKKHEGKEKLSICDAFTGSGATARFFKAHAEKLLVNDLENYVEVLSKCYLANRDEVPFEKLEEEFLKMQKHMEKGLEKGFISELYAPEDDENIKQNERVFFTTRNANYIDTARRYMEKLPESIRHFFIAPLIY